MTGSEGFAEGVGLLREAEAALRALDPQSRPPLLAEQVVAGARGVVALSLRAYLAAQGEPGEEGASELAALVARCSRHDPDFAQLAYAVEVLDLGAADDPSRPCLAPNEDDAAEAVEMAAGIYRFVSDRV